MRQWDDYFWPGETVLANLLGEHDKLALQDAEYQITTMRQEEIERGAIAINRTYDGPHLQAIHRAFFADVYDWAGEIRQIGISKDFTEFAPPQRIGIYLNDVARVVRDTPWKSIDRGDVVANAARVYALGNVAHPFRQGNTRSQVVYSTQLAERAGYDLDFTRLAGGADLPADFVNARYHHLATGTADRIAAVIDKAVRLITPERPVDRAPSLNVLLAATSTAGPSRGPSATTLRTAASSAVLEPGRDAGHDTGR